MSNFKDGSFVSYLIAQDEFLPTEDEIPLISMQIFLFALLHS